jgi:hypothetical protein
MADIANIEVPLPAQLYAPIAGWRKERSGYRLQPATDHENLTVTYEAFALWVITQHPAFDDIVAWFRARIVRAGEN